MRKYRLSYSELLSIDSFADRFEYLSLSGKIGRETFGSQRYLNQEFYRSREWKRLRDSIILRDNGCDLAVDGRDILGLIIVHHINPVTLDDIVSGSPEVWDPENLICSSITTHNAIHYGSTESLYPDPIARTPNDTCPWKGGRL